MDDQSIRLRYTAEFAVYERLAKKVADLIQTKLHTHGIQCLVEQRAKSMHSLMKKARRTGEPYERLFDKAGTRIIVPYKEWIPIAKQVVEDSFTVSYRDDKAARYAFKEFDYLGMHYGVSLKEEDLTDETGEFAGLNCEVQVQTGAENLWMSVSHDLTFKPDVELPLDLMRSMHRLMALMEVFDSEVHRIRHGLTNDDSFVEYRLLDTLERQYYRFVGNPYDRTLSFETLRVLKPLLADAEIDDFQDLMANFATRHFDKITSLYAEHMDDPESDMLFQPETLLIFERLEAHKSSLTAAWTHLPTSILEQISEIWGDPVITEYR